MKKLLLLAAAAGMLAVSAPANAAPWDRYDRDSNINERQADLNGRIDQGVRDGSLTRTEALNLRAQARQIAFLERRYRYNGLAMWERRDLDRRLDRLAQNIRYERHDAETRYRGYRG